MPGIGVIVNPRSGKNRKVSDRAKRLAAILGDAGWVREPRSLDELAEVVRDFRERGIEILAVCGGDGTFFRALTALARVYRTGKLPAFLPLRAGSMNTIARALGCPSWTPERMLESVLAGRRRGVVPQTVDRALIRVNGNEYGLMVGAGTVVSFLRAYYDTGLPGPVGATKLVARVVAAAATRGPLVAEVFQWVDARVTCDGKAVPFKSFSIIYAATVEEIGLGFMPTYRAGEPGRFHFLAGPLDAAEGVRRLPRIYRGLPTKSRQLFDSVAKRVVVEFTRPNSYMINGDLLDPVSRLTMDVGPSLRIILR